MANHRTIPLASCLSTATALAFTAAAHSESLPLEELESPFPTERVEVEMAPTKPGETQRSAVSVVPDRNELLLEPNWADPSRDGGFPELVVRTQVQIPAGSSIIDRSGKALSPDPDVLTAKEGPKKGGTLRIPVSIPVVDISGSQTLLTLVNPGGDTKAINLVAKVQLDRDAVLSHPLCQSQSLRLESFGVGREPQKSSTTSKDVPKDSKPQAARPAVLLLMNCAVSGSRIDIAIRSASPVKWVDPPKGAKLLQGGKTVLIETPFLPDSEGTSIAMVSVQPDTGKDIHRFRYEEVSDAVCQIRVHRLDVGLEREGGVETIGHLARQIEPHRVAPVPGLDLERRHAERVADPLMRHPPCAALPRPETIG